MIQRKGLIRSICVSLADHIHFLDNASIELGDDIIIIGTTLWSHIKPRERSVIEYCLNDFNYINVGDSTLMDVDIYLQSDAF